MLMKINLKGDSRYRGGCSPFFWAAPCYWSRPPDTDGLSRRIRRRGDDGTGWASYLTGDAAGRPEGDKILVYAALGTAAVGLMLAILDQKVKGQGR